MSNIFVANPIIPQGKSNKLDPDEVGLLTDVKCTCAKALEQRMQRERECKRDNARFKHDRQERLNLISCWRKTVLGKGRFKRGLFCVRNDLGLWFIAALRHPYNTYTNGFPNETKPVAVRHI